LAPSTSTTDTRSLKAKGKAPIRASLTTLGPPTMLAPSLFASLSDANQYTPLAESSAPSMSSGLPASRSLEQSASSTIPCSADQIYVPLTCGTESQTVLPYGSVEADTRVRGNVTAEPPQLQNMMETRMCA
jgi:hypothetical protein